MSTVATDGAENRRHLIAYVLPFVLFMAITAVEGRPELQAHYPIVYTAKVVLVALGLAWSWKRWPRFETRGLTLGILLGAVGLPVWIALSKIELANVLPEAFAGYLSSSRTGFDPAGFSCETCKYSFVAVRLVGLAVVVPLMEELFWRGFLIRFLIAEPFQKVPMGTYTPMSFAVVTLLFVAAHPEILAALVWGAAINLLLYRTKNLWACVAMHATTNALLGAYILSTGAWHLW
jgi:CAAX prenyl protease-like protein